MLDIFLKRNHLRNIVNKGNNSSRAYVRNYTNGSVASRLLGPFNSPRILTAAGTVAFFYLLFLFPLDPYLFNARKIKRINDEKVMNS